MHVLELTFWNDAPARTQREVVDLLLAARQTADAQEDRCRSEQAELVVATAQIAAPPYSPGESRDEPEDIRSTRDTPASSWV
jgi:hypothetical protein